MSAVVVLDAGPLGLLTNPNNSPQAVACRAWLATLISVGRRVVLPEIADYEIRRELIRIASHVAIANLDAFCSQLEYLPLSTVMMHSAAQLWATARNCGQPTAANAALDCDVILAAQALSLGIPVIVATGNLGHVARFVLADIWQNILP